MKFGEKKKRSYSVFWRCPYEIEVGGVVTDMAVPGLVEAVMELEEVVGKDRQRALALCLRSLV